MIIDEFLKLSPFDSIEFIDSLTTEEKAAILAAINTPNGSIERMKSILNGIDYKPIQSNI